MQKRKTRQREVILKVLRRTRSHPTADQIYDEVRKIIPNISKGTVYRNLKVLREAGLVSEINLSGAVSRFEVRLDKHYHFRCENCGRVFDIGEPIDRELERRVSERTGLNISSHQLEFRGICPECAAGLKEAGKQ